MTICVNDTIIPAAAVAVEAALHAGAPDPHTGHLMRYVNPADGGWAMPTIATMIRLLPAGFETLPMRSTDGTVFIDSEADAQDPYVQQAVGYTVRLYYATPLVSGQLDQDPPAGATLQRVGEDAQYAREVGGRTYTVVERHYLLIPERSGTLTIPGARFEGKAAGGFFDDLLGDGQQDLRASSAPRVIRVRPRP